jgi:hypothetical protein
MTGIINVKFKSKAERLYYQRAEQAYSAKKLECLRRVSNRQNLNYQPFLNRTTRFNDRVSKALNQPLNIEQNQDQA